MEHGQKLIKIMTIKFKPLSIRRRGFLLFYSNTLTFIVALEWWKQIKEEMSYLVELEKIIADNQDITQLVRKLEEDEWRKKNDAVEDLPF